MSERLNFIGNLLWCLAGVFLLISGVRNVVMGTPRPIINVSNEPKIIDKTTTSVYAEVIEMDPERWDEFKLQIRSAIEEKAMELMEAQDER